MKLIDLITFEDTFGRSVFLNPKYITAICRETNGSVTIYTSDNCFYTRMDIQDVLSQIDCEIMEPPMPSIHQRDYV